MVVQPDVKLTAVADASFLIGLAFIDQIASLDMIFERIYVANAVWNEVVTNGSDRPGAGQVENARCISQKSVQSLQAVAMLELFLGRGEAETLALAQELSVPLVLMDELRGRKAAQQAGIRTMGVVGFLLLARNAGIIVAVKPQLDMLMAKGFHLSQKLIEVALKQAGES